MSDLPSDLPSGPVSAAISSAKAVVMMYVALCAPITALLG
jgi:hypothetical protein